MKWISWISIINGLFLIFLTLSEINHWVTFPLIFSYQTHKFLHILGVILFMGNMIVGPIWFSFAYFSKDEKLLSYANKLLQVTDLGLTIPGVFLTVINGLFLASSFGGTQNLPWLQKSIISLFVMWILSIPLIYLQEKLYVTMDNEPGNRQKLNTLLFYWSILGTFVMLPPTYVFYLMVFKPV